MRIPQDNSRQETNKTIQANHKTRQDKITQEKTR